MAKLRVDKIAASGQTSENTGSVFFDGTGDYFDISKAPFQFLHKLTHAWTVECWFYKTADAQGTLFDTGGSSDTAIGTAVYINTGGDVRLRVRQALSGTVVSEDNAGAVSLNTWHHFALTFDGQVIRTFIDGAIISTVNYSTQSSTDSTQTLKIGVYEYSGTTKGGYFQGYISNFRICKGHAVYTSNFAPPTRELEVHQGPDDDRTVLLCCYDGENIFADKSGRHIIAAYGDRTSSPTPTATDSPIGITTFQPGLTRSVDVTDGPVFQGGAGYASQNWLTLPKGTTTERDSHGGHRGLFIAGSSTNTIEYITLSTTGNAIDFGDTSGGTTASAACSSSTRGVSAGGLATPVQSDTIEYVTIATLGNTIDFGNLTVARRNLGAASNSTRGLFFGGDSPSDSDVIDYITISSTGNALDFGNLSTAVANIYGCASPTRGILGGGESPTILNTIEYVTIASTGNAQDFGDLFQTRSRFTSTGSGTRGVFASGRTPTNVNTIDYVTIASTGNAADFGDVSQARENPAATSDSVRGVIAGGYVAPTNTNLIDFIVIPAMGNAQDFGDLISARREFGACSSGHGGLG